MLPPSPQRWTEFYLSSFFVVFLSAGQGQNKALLSGEGTKSFDVDATGVSATLFRGSEGGCTGCGVMGMDGRPIGCALEGVGDSG